MNPYPGEGGKGKVVVNPYPGPKLTGPDLFRSGPKTYWETAIEILSSFDITLISYPIHLAIYWGTWESAHPNGIFCR